MPKLTAGLNRPPEMRKKIHALTIKDMPKDRLTVERCGVHRVGAAEGEEEEEKSASELGHHGDEMILDDQRKSADDW